MKGLMSRWSLTVAAAAMLAIGATSASAQQSDSSVSGRKPPLRGMVSKTDSKAAARVSARDRRPALRASAASTRSSAVRVTGAPRPVVNKPPKSAAPADTNPRR